MSAHIHTQGQAVFYAAGFESFLMRLTCFIIF